MHGCCWVGRRCVERIAERVERRTVLDVDRAVISLCVMILEGRGEELLGLLDVHFGGKDLHSGLRKIVRKFSIADINISFSGYAYLELRVTKTVEIRETWVSRLNKHLLNLNVSHLSQVRGSFEPISEAKRQICGPSDLGIKVRNHVEMEQWNKKLKT